MTSFMTVMYLSEFQSSLNTCYSCYSCLRYGPQTFLPHTVIPPLLPLQAMDPTIAVIMFITVASYMPVTIIISEWRGKLRREVNRTSQV